MSYTYDSRKKAANAPGKEVPAQAPSVDALVNGTAAPTSEQLGHRVDLPDAMREKMENAFGADLSSVKLYESETVGEAGAEAVAQGSDIAFAPGMLDFTSFEGQARLGHEISHVVSQERGEVTGAGFLNDHALEARADREGAMAASGQQITAPVSAMSSASAAPAAGPMQAKKKKEMTADDKVRKMHAIKAQGNLNPGGVRRRDQRWYDSQVQSMSPDMVSALLSQIVDTSNQLQATRNGFIAEGKGDDEADTRALYSGAGDDFSIYQLMTRELGMQNPNVADALEQQYGQLPSEATSSLAETGDMFRRGFSNSFSDTAAGQAVHDQNEREGAIRARKRYRKLR